MGWGPPLHEGALWLCKGKPFIFMVSQAPMTNLVKVFLFPQEDIGQRGWSPQAICRLPIVSSAHVRVDVHASWPSALYTEQCLGWDQAVGQPAHVSPLSTRFPCRKRAIAPCWCPPENSAPHLGHTHGRKSHQAMNPLIPIGDLLDTRSNAVPQLLWASDWRVNLFGSGDCPEALIANESLAKDQHIRQSATHAIRSSIWFIIC